MLLIQWLHSSLGLLSILSFHYVTHTKLPYMESVKIREKQTIEKQGITNKRLSHQKILRINITGDNRSLDNIPYMLVFLLELL